MITSILLLFVVSCSVEPKPIHYNLDVCEYCHMVITDVRYGTETLTSKGKAYKFDSVECLIDYCKENKPNVHQHLVTCYGEPHSLYDAKNTWVIKCNAMPSPMGRYLTAFKSKQEADEIVEEKGGIVMSFEDALENL